MGGTFTTTGATTLTGEVTADAGFASPDLQVDTVNFTSTQILAMHTPITLVGNAGADTIIVVESILFVVDSTGTAYADVAAGDDIIIEYETSGADIITNLETTGFIDQTDDEIRLVQPLEVTADLLASINKDVMIKLGGAITTGTGTMIVTVAYRVMPTGL